MLLLGQAGVPFTTGFLAKFGVVEASVDTHAYALAVVAMVSAAVAAFFYLRVAVTMFSPVGEIADPTGSADPAGAYDNPGPGDGAPRTGRAGRSWPTPGVPRPRRVQPAGAHRCTSGRVGGDRGLVPVPALTTVAIGISVAFTVVFGIIPEPILDFAHQATLLFT